MIISSVDNRSGIYNHSEGGGEGMGRGGGVNNVTLGKKETSERKCIANW